MPVTIFGRLTAIGLAVALQGPIQAQESVFVGQLVDYTGPTSFVGKFYSPGIKDAVDWINTQGGVDGTEIRLEQVDYAYKVPQAIANYKRWLARNDMIALQGWGTADTEALISFVARDQVPVWSASYSGHLTDPKGQNPKTPKPAPFNFFYGPSYSDGCRALAQWAAMDAEERGLESPSFIHLGDNHPYPNAPKAACGEYAAELGFEMLPPIVVPLKPGDFKAQCLTLKESGADYAFIANLGGSVVALLKSCQTVGATPVFMANIWGGDYRTIEAAGAKDYVFPTATPFWDSEAPGMALVRQIHAQGSSGEEKPTHHYIRGICSAFYMKEAMAWAKANGGLTGDNIRKGMYAQQDWVPEGLEGVCLPSTWTPEDHRGTTVVSINRGSYQDDGSVAIEKLTDITLPRRPDWVGY
ncbi:MAG: ABC transporter substrate-binding protein [Candidatus Competibacterales bacterium]